MNHHRQDRHRELAVRELVVIDDALNHQITCHAGELWITVDGDRRDIILAAGRHWRAEVGGPIVISGLAPSVFSLAHPPHCREACQARRQGAEWALALLRRWKLPPLAALPGLRLY